MNPRYILFLILGIDAVILFLETSNISISYDESLILYGSPSVLQYVTKASLALFGHNDYGLRFGMLLLHLTSVVLMYLISRRYIKQERNRLWLVLVFVLLPGVVSSAVIINSAGFVLFGLLLYIYIAQKSSLQVQLALLTLYSFLDFGFSYLFLGLAIYYAVNKQRAIGIYLIALYILSGSLYGFDMIGTPKGHFLDTIGVYSAVFTPIIFIYLFYALYRRYLTSKIDKLWYIASTALILSLLLSFRQRIEIEYFAPYLIVALPLAAQSFISSYNVRLKQFRTKYKLVFVLSFVFLIFNTFIVFFNKELYLIIKNPKQHFAYDMYIAKDLAKELQSKHISCVVTDKKMQSRLKFYDVSKCDNNVLKEIDLSSKRAANVTISYKNKILYKANVTNLNNI